VTDENRRGVKERERERDTERRRARDRERDRAREREREGGSRLCVREEFNPQKRPNGSCSVQMGKKGS